MSEAAEHADGTVTYKDFATKAAGVLLLMEDVRAQRVWEAEQEEAEELEGEEEEEEDDGMPGLPNTSELAEIILSTFQQADT